MNFNHKARKIIEQRRREDILDLLGSVDKELTTHDISVCIGSSDSYTFGILRNLKKEKLVGLRTKGRGRYWRLQ